MLLYSLTVTEGRKWLVNDKASDIARVSACLMTEWKIHRGISSLHSLLPALKSTFCKVKIIVSHVNTTWLWLVIWLVTRLAVMSLLDSKHFLLDPLFTGFKLCRMQLRTRILQTSKRQILKGIFLLSGKCLFVENNPPTMSVQCSSSLSSSIG